MESLQLDKKTKVCVFDPCVFGGYHKLTVHCSVKGKQGDVFPWLVINRKCAGE